MALRETEVQQLHARAREHDVGRLQVTVHNALFVCRDQRIGDVDGVGDRLFDRERTAADSSRERLAIEQFHDEIGDDVGAIDRGNTDVVDRTDSRMREPRDRACFAFEPLAGARRAVALGGEDFDRDLTIEPGIAGTVDLAHAAGAEQFDNREHTERRAGSEARLT